MKYYRRTTQVPNDIFDLYLSILTESMLKVLLVIIRQTVGYLTKNARRKPSDWIAIGYFEKRTGLSRKTITQALSKLITMNLVIALDSQKRELLTAKERQGKKRIYYAYKPYYLSYHKQTCAESSSNMSSIHPITKPIPTKPSFKLTDRERILEILNQSK